MTERLLLTALVSFTLGIFVWSLTTSYAFLLLFISFLGVLFALAWFFGRRDVYLYPTLFFLLLSLGGLRASLVPTAPPTFLVSIIGVPATLTGTVVADPDVRENNQRITVEVGEGGQRTKLLVVADRYQTYEYGDVVSVEGTPTLPEAFDTDGGRTFAYDKFLAKDGIFALVEHAKVTKTDERHGPLAWMLRTLLSGKHAFAHALEDALPEPHASLAEGLLVGGKQGLGKELLNDFTIAGLLPIVVLSGYNVMIVAESLLAFLGFLPRRFSLIIAALSIAAFVFIGGAGSSALRAGLMAAIALFARSTGRSYAALRALLFVFVVMLLWSPLSLVYDPGFDFSFLATLGLILLSDPLAAHWVRFHPHWLREVASTTVAAQLFVLPLLLYETGMLSFFAIPANLLVLPAVPFAMLFSAIAGAISLVIPVLATIAGLPAYALLSYIIGIAEGIGNLPFASVVVPAFPFWLVLIAYALVGYIAWRIAKSAPAYTGAPVRSKS